jgi:hypothetical protein
MPCSISTLSRWNNITLLYTPDYTNELWFTRTMCEMPKGRVESGPRNNANCLVKKRPHSSKSL